MADADQSSSRERWQRLEEIFTALSGMPSEERAAWLDRVCGEDTALKQDAASLLAHTEGSTGSLQGLVDASAASVAAEESAVGRRFGPYIATARIGAGGMGAVYLAARDDDQFRKSVAIKLIKLGMDTAAVVGRFRHERQILAGLDHPYIARLLDGGSTPEGLPYFVMEYIQGKPIDEYCESSGLTLEQRCELFRKMCEAVSYAHRNLVVHRDLKPGNILVTEDGTPKLLDFGIAKILTPERGDATTMTQARAMTPEYASPEQVLGTAVTTATDVYGLGAVLYKLLTGCHAQRIDGLTAAEAEAAICRCEPIKPSEAASEKLGRRLRGDLDNIVMMAIRKEPQRRYASVDALSEDLQRYLAGLPVRARQDSTLYRAGKFFQRHRVGVAATALITVSLAAAAVVSIREARIAEQRLGQMAELANTSLFDIHDIIERLPGATEARRQMVAATLQYFDRLAKTSGNDPRVQEVRAAAYMRLGDVQGLPDSPNLGDTAGAEASYRKALALLDRTAAKGGDLTRLKRTSELEHRLGLIAWNANRLTEAERRHRQSLSLLEEIATRTGDVEARRQVADENISLSKVLEDDRPGSGLEYALKAAKLDEELSARQTGDDALLFALSEAYSAVGRSYYITDHLQASLEWFQKTVQLRERLTAAHPADLRYRRDLMMAYAHAADALGNPWGPNLGDAAGAKAFFGKAVGMAEDMAAADPNNVNAQIDLMAALLRQGIVDPAPAATLDSLAILRRAETLGEGIEKRDPKNGFVPETLTTIREYLGTRLAEAGHRPEALKEYDRSLEAAQRLASEDPKNLSMHCQVLADYRGIADVRAGMGQRQEAIGVARKAIETVDGYLAAGLDSQNIRAYAARCRQWLGAIYEKCGDPVRARAAYQESLTLWTRLADGPDKGLYEKEISDVRAKLTGR